MFSFRKFAQKWESYSCLKFGKALLRGWVGPGLRLLASMATRNTIRGWAMKRVGSKLSARKSMSFAAASQAKNGDNLSCGAHYTIYRAFCLISFALEELCVCIFTIRFAPRKLLQWYVYHYNRPNSYTGMVFWSLSDKSRRLRRGFLQYIPHRLFLASKDIRVVVMAVRQSFHFLPLATEVRFETACVVSKHFFGC